MHKIERLLQTLAPKGVEFRKLGEVLEYDQPNKYCVTSKEFDKSYPTPVLTAGKTFILGYTNEKDNIYQASKNAPVIIFDDFTTATQWVDFPFKVKSSAMKILLPKSPTINIRFIFFYMQTIPYNISGEYTRQWISRYSQITIPIPPLEIQQEIVKILDAFTELNTELKARKKQYEYYQNMLLDFNDINQNHKDAKERLAQKTYPKRLKSLLQTLAPKGVEFRKLGEVCEILDNRRIPIAKNKRNPGIYPYYGANGIQDYIDSYIFDGDFVLVGEDGSVINKDNTPVVNWASGKIWVNNHAHVLQTKNELKLKFLYFYLQTIDVSYCVAGTPPKINQENLKKITIPIPPLEIQQEIVKILDQFGFTGTPIFAQNCDKNNPLGTTEQKFGECLHQYTIIDAIRDKNVLPFRVEYHNTIKAKEGIIDNKVRAVDEKNALLDTRRIKEITKCILERFNQATKNKKFNSILACSSIEALKKYYRAFKEEKHDLKIATIFSYSANEELDALEDENNESTNGLDESSRDFLEGAIADYNGMFKTSFDTSDQKFQSYYKDLSQKVKDREIDLLMVVNMFLTGFDATRLNTLWVDKNLKHHGLIQAFSRANRILDSVKTHGNIVCFRDLEQDLNDALMLFGNKDAKSIALLRKYEDYLKGYTDNNKEYEGYERLIERLLREFPLKEPIISESQKKDFIKLFGKILKLENILNSFENFKKDDYINPRDFQDYQSKYLDFYDEMRPEKGRDKEEINDDLIFEIELIKQVEVNIDYILNLIEEFAKEHDLEIQGVKTKMEPIINSSIELRNKKDLIMDFIDKYNKDQEVHAYFQDYIHQKREEEFQKLIEENRLNEEKAYSFMQHAFKGGEISFSGTEFPKIIKEKPSRFDKSSRYQEVKEKVAASLSRFFHRFCDLTSHIFKKNGVKKDEINEK
ncbi:HsdR family type I site-specific deoxyribonuclease [Helicobacter pylori]|nr:HsdR family type I site-specific deoxyribonuclease [Helicobacter pylori]